MTPELTPFEGKTAPKYAYLCMILSKLGATELNNKLNKIAQKEQEITQKAT